MYNSVVVFLLSSTDVEGSNLLPYTLGTLFHDFLDSPPVNQTSVCMLSSDAGSLGGLIFGFSSVFKNNGGSTVFKRFDCLSVF